MINAPSSRITDQASRFVMYIAAVIISGLSAWLIVFFRPDDTYPIITYGVAIPLLIVLLLIVLHWRRVQPTLQKSLGQITFLMVLLNAPGTVYFHVTGFYYQYDRFLHFSIGFLLIPTLLLFFEFFHIRWSSTEKMRRTALWVAFLGLFVWEGWQYLNDLVFKTHMFFDYGQSIRVDVVEDILFGTIGLGLWLFLNRKKEARP